MAFPSPQTALLNNDDLTIADTTAETDLFSYTIPVRHLDGTHGIRVTIWGERVNASGGVVAFTFRAKLGATTMWEASETFASASTQCPFLVSLDLFAKGSDSAQEVFGHLVMSPQAAAAVGSGGISSAGAVAAVLYGESVEDGTTDLNFVVTVEMDTAHAAAIVVHRKSTVELI